MPIDLSRLRLPPPSVPLSGPDGRMSPDWYRYFVELGRVLSALNT
jgi:hypothetical protein